MIVFAYTKFSLVQMQGSGVKRRAESPPPPQSERVFQISVQIGLSYHQLLSSFSLLQFCLIVSYILRISRLPIANHNFVGWDVHIGILTFLPALI